MRILKRNNNFWISLWILTMKQKKTKQRENKFANFLHNFLYFLHKHSKAALNSQTMSMLTARAWTESVYEYGVRLKPRFCDSADAFVLDRDDDVDGGVRGLNSKNNSLALENLLALGLPR